MVAHSLRSCGAGKVNAGDKPAGILPLLQRGQALERTEFALGISDSLLTGLRSGEHLDVLLWQLELARDYIEDARHHHRWRQAARRAEL